ncbi:hypothetical protein GCM10018966_056270 [Streptomyces yanii]
MGTDAGRAALEPAGQGTRIADAARGVTDEAWANAAKHYDVDQLAALVCAIALVNASNRGNVTVQQPAGDCRPGRSPAGMTGQPSRADSVQHRPGHGCGELVE